VGGELGVHALEGDHRLGVAGGLIVGRAPDRERQSAGDGQRQRGEHERHAREARRGRGVIPPSQR
jgi:hypothetical protein